MLDFYGNDSGEEDEDEDEDGDDREDRGGEEEPEVEPPPLPLKRKRPAEPSKGPTAPPKRRVAFDLQKPAKSIGLPSKHTPPNPSIKKSALASKKQR